MIALLVLVVLVLVSPPVPVDHFASSTTAQQQPKEPQS